MTTDSSFIGSSSSMDVDCAAALENVRLGESRDVHEDTRAQTDTPSTSLLEKLASIDESLLDKIIASAATTSPSPITRSSMTTTLDYRVMARTPPTYDGTDPVKADDYVAAVRSCIAERNLSTDHDKIILFANFLAGSALSWWNSFCVSSDFEESGRTIDHAIEMFLKRFASPQRVAEAKEALLNPQRDVHLAHHCTTFLNKYLHYNAICSEAEKLSDPQAIKLLVQSLNKIHWNQIRAYGIRFLNVSIDDFVGELTHAHAQERTLIRWEHEVDAQRKYHKDHIYWKGKRTHSMDEYKARPDIQAFHKSRALDNRKKMRVLQCNRCHQYGHKSIDCPKRDHFDVDAPMPGTCSFCGIRGHDDHNCFKKHPELKTRSHKLAALTKPASFKVKINGHSQYVTVDSYCTCSLMTTEMAKALGVKLLHDKDTTKMVMADNTPIQGSGKFITEAVSMQMGNHIEMISFKVIPSCVSPILLGIDWLQKHNHNIT
jgi:hypothetical protein